MTLHKTLVETLDLNMYHFMILCRNWLFQLNVSTLLYNKVSIVKLPILWVLYITTDSIRAFSVTLQGFYSSSLVWLIVLVCTFITKLKFQFSQSQDSREAHTMNSDKRERKKILCPKYFLLNLHFLHGQSLPPYFSPSG